MNLALEYLFLNINLGFVALEEGEKGIIVDISFDVRYYERRLRTKCRFVSSFPRRDTTGRISSDSSFREFVLSSFQFDSSAGLSVLLRVRLISGHIGLPLIVILTIRRFDSSTKIAMCSMLNWLKDLKNNSHCINRKF